jgi:hypothetical protein
MPSSTTPCAAYLSLHRIGSTSTTPCATTTRHSVALALLRLCCASGRAVSTLDFSSVGRTGSRRVPGHSIVRRDHLSRGRNGYTLPTPRVRVPRHLARLVTRLVVDYFDYAARPGASAPDVACCAARRAARHRLVLLHHASGCLGTSRGSSSTTSPHASLPSTTSPTSRVWVARLVVDSFAYAARLVASARRAARHTVCRVARRRLLRLRRASGCLGMSRGLSRGLLRGSSSTTLPTSRVRVPRHVAWLVVDHCASSRSSSRGSPRDSLSSTSPTLCVSHWLCMSRGLSSTIPPHAGLSSTTSPRAGSYAAHPGASASRTACLVARRRLLHLRLASGCLGTSRGSSRGSLSTTSPTPRVRVPWQVAWIVMRLVIDYFDYTACPGSSAPRVARHVARRTARRRLLRLRRASECLGTSHGSSHRSSSTSTTPCVRVPRHITWLVIDYSVRCDFVLRAHWLYFSRAVRRDYLSRGNTGSTSNTPRAVATSSSSRIASTIHLD